MATSVKATEAGSTDSVTTLVELMEDALLGMPVDEKFGYEL